MKIFTLKDVASHLKLSITTVSKALKNYPDVSPKTKKRVLDYVESINFKPNTHAAFLRTRETKLLGIVIPNLSHYFFNNVIKAIIDDAQKHGYMVVILNSRESYEKEVSHVHSLLHQNVDGIFLSIAQDTNSFEHFNEIIETKTPLILFDKISKLVSCSKVVIDDRKAAFKATEHLIQNGRTKIAHFRGALKPQIAIDRFLGYRDALEHYGIPFDKNRVLICDQGDEVSGRQAAKTLMKNKVEVDGIFAVTDLTAIGAMGYLEQHHYKIPDDIAIIGFSNWQISGFTKPALSTVNQPGDLIGKKVLQLFLQEKEAQKRNQPFEYETHVIPTELVIRASSGAPK